MTEPQRVLYLKDLLLTDNNSPLHIGDTSTGSNDWAIINAPFNEPRLDTAGTPYFHKGLDLYTYNGNSVSGRPVWNTYTGTIYKLGFDSGLGNYVIIEHSKLVSSGTAKWRTVYAHLNRINPALQAGQSVTRSTWVGDSGMTGAADGHIHLHLEFLDPSTGYKLPPDFFYRGVSWGLNTTYGGASEGSTGLAFRFRGILDGVINPPLNGSVILHYLPANQTLWQSLVMTSSDEVTFSVDFADLVPKGTPSVRYWVDAQDNSWNGEGYLHAYRPVYGDTQTEPATSLALVKTLSWTGPLVSNIYESETGMETPVQEFLTTEGYDTAGVGLLVRREGDAWLFRSNTTGELLMLRVAEDSPVSPFLGEGKTIKFAGRCMQTSQEGIRVIDVPANGFTYLVIPGAQ